MRLQTLTALSAIVVLVTTTTVGRSQDSSRSLEPSSRPAPDAAAADGPIEFVPYAASMAVHRSRPDFNFPCCPRLNPWANFSQEKRCDSGGSCGQCAGGVFAWLFGCKKKEGTCQPSVDGDVGPSDIVAGGLLKFKRDLFSLFAFGSSQTRPTAAVDDADRPHPLHDTQQYAKETTTNSEERLNNEIAAPQSRDETSGPLTESSRRKQAKIDETPPAETEAPISVRPMPMNPAPAIPRNPEPLLPRNSKTQERPEPIERGARFDIYKRLVGESGG